MAEGKKKDEIILRKIYRVLEKIGIHLFPEEVPDRISGCEILRDKRLVVVDDTAEILMLMVTRLSAETNGKAEFVLHKKGETLKQLARRILRKKPEIVLLDGRLADDMKGFELVPYLLAEDSSIICIGFSADEKMKEDFIGAGAQGFIRKIYIDNPERTARQISEELSDIQSRQKQ